MKDRYLFLDIDGVLNTLDYAKACQWKDGKVRDEYGALFDPYTVENLKYILDSVPVKLVISSSWKFYGVPKLREMWKKRNLPGTILDITPNTISDEMLLNANLDEFQLGVCRGNEIKEWLSRHEDIISNYVIIDDFDDMLSEQEDHVVLTESLIGITEWEAEKAIKILNCY